MKTTKFFVMLAAVAVLSSCQKDKDTVNNQEPDTNSPLELSQIDKDATAGIENALAMIGLYTDSLVNATHNSQKHHYDIQIHHHDSLFWHHHGNYSHNNEHDDHHHDNTGNHNTHGNTDHGTHAHGDHNSHNHDSLHVDNQHGQHHHNDHGNNHNNHDGHHQGHHIGHHETLDSLVHVHQQHHP